MQYLPLSTETKTMIEQRMREGYTKRYTRVAIQVNFCKYNQSIMADNNAVSGSIVRRDQMIHVDEICGK